MTGRGKSSNSGIKTGILLLLLNYIFKSEYLLNAN